MDSQRTEKLVLWLVALTALVILSSTVIVPHPGGVVTDRIALLAVLLVGVVARRWGVRPGIVASVVGFLVIGGLIYPEGFVAGLDAEPYVDLAIFLAVALLGGMQIGQLRERERIAIENERSMELASRLGAQMISDLPRSEVLERVLEEVGRALAADVEFVLTPGVDGVLSAARASMRERLDRGSAAYLIAEFAYTHQRAIGQPIRRGDALDIENEFSSATAVGLVEEGPSLAVPLRSASCIEGVLYVGRHRQSGHFSSRQAQFVLLVGGLIAQFIERQRLEQAAVQLRALEQADLLKSALVASVSHELRSPLAAVAAAITGLISHADQVDPEYLVSELTSAADDLRTLDGRIGAILDISRLEAASWAPTPEWHDIGDLCQAVRSAVPAAARERVRIALPAQLPPAWFDFVQMGRVLHHIVENALDYSPPTSAVTIGAEVRSSCLALWVEDAGVGIPDSEKSLIFEKFYRGSSGGARTHGTGLGLAIASEIVKQHGGRIELEDVEPQGARFVIQLPMTEGGRCGE